METQIDDATVIQYIDILAETFRYNSTKIPTDEMRALYKKKEFTSCIFCIKQVMRLPNKFKIYYIVGKPKGKKSTTKMFGDIATRVMRYICSWFRPIVRKDAGNRVRLVLPDTVKNAPAFVRLPRDIALYGTKEFIETEIIMYLRREITEECFETFVFAIAHECSHVLLHALCHKLRYSEVATDLTAMLLGFHELANTGHRMSVNKRYGYLNRHQFQLAYKKICTII